MGWEGTRMLTNGEHDDLWREMAKSQPRIGASLRRANAIAILKELHAIGEISIDNYKKGLVEILKSEGFETK